jgi:hypothetical protein
VTLWQWLLIGLAVVLLLGLFYRRGLAGRADRMRLRVDSARNALDAQLVRRAALVTDLAATTLLDPASSVVLAEAAFLAQDVDADDDERETAESALSQDLRAVFGELDDLEEEIAELDPQGRQLLTALATACDRVVLARSFYNDAARAARDLAVRPTVRILAVPGLRPPPTTFEIDDTPPLGLSGLVRRPA